MTEFQTNDNYIYKYVPFSVNTLKLLIKGELWFGLPINLNDPFEGEFLFDEIDNLPDEDFIIEFYEKEMKLPKYQLDKKLSSIENDKEEFFKDLQKRLKENLKNDYGVSCFSKKPDNILMWSHYADSHKGICLVFDKNGLLQSLRKMYRSIQVEDVDYKPYLPKVTMSFTKDKIHLKPDIDIYLRKLDNWDYEGEIRFYNDFYGDDKNSRRSVPFDKTCLKHIILGEKIEHDNRSTLVHLIKNNKDYNVKWGVAEKDLENKKMFIQAVDFAIIKDIKVNAKISSTKP